MEASPKLSTGEEEVEVETGEEEAAAEEEEKEPHSHYLDRISNKEGYRAAVYWVSGDSYCGEWHNNLRDGRGMQVYKNGNRYEGEFKAGKREGLGTFWIIDGKYYIRKYRGSWKANYYHGPGLLYGFGGEMYNGEFQRGKRHGMGHQMYRDWTSKEERYHTYQGQWVNDKREGLGCLTMVDGNVYQGHFKNDWKEGMGVFYFKDRESKYEGLWRDDIAQSGSYSRNTLPGQLVVPLLMVPSFQQLRDKCLRMAAARPLPPRYDRTKRRTDPAVCTRKFSGVPYGSPLLS